MMSGSDDAGRLSLLGLPEEILANIVHHLALSVLPYIESLKALRLVHPHLAYLKRLLQECFNCIQLTMFGARNILRSSAILSQVQTVTFKSSAEAHFVASRGQGNFYLDENQAQQIASQQQSSDALSNTDAAEAAVANFLTCLPRLRCAKICVRLPIAEPGDSTTHPCLGPLVTHCIIKAGIKLEEFHHTEYDEPSSNMGADEIYLGNEYRNFERIDLGNLKTFMFRSEGSFELGHPEQDDPACYIRSTLQKCASTLERLYLRSNQLTVGKILCVNPMIVLRCLHVEKCLIVPDRFALWISLSPRLEELILRRVEPGFWQAIRISWWRPIFDALKDHPNRMRVVFDDVRMKNMKRTFSLECHTANGVEISEESDEDGALESDDDFLRRMLINWMAGTAAWELPPGWL